MIVTFVLFILAVGCGVGAGLLLIRWQLLSELREAEQEAWECRRKLGESNAALIAECTAHAVTRALLQEELSAHAATRAELDDARDSATVTGVYARASLSAAYDSRIVNWGERDNLPDMSVPFEPDIDPGPEGPDTRDITPSGRRATSCMHP